MKGTVIVFLLAFYVLVITSPVHYVCAGEGEEIDVRGLASSYNNFGFDLYSEIVDSFPQTNTFVSPASIALALAMTINGASGETEQSMGEALHITGLGRGELNEANKALIESLEGAAPDVALSIANSLWLKKGFTFYEEFTDCNRHFFEADVFVGLSPSRINGWVKEKTEGKIAKIVGSVPPEVIAYIINAIYFKGSWSEEFDKTLTLKKEFHLADGSTRKVPLMRQKGEYRYFECPEFQAASLPYGEGRVSMYVFLPREGSNLSDFQDTLAPEHWKRWTSGFSSRDGYIELPRFTMEFGTSLKSALRKIGMEEPFSSGRADFSRMGSRSSGNIYISDVIHKTFVDVNEEGTEAAAVTSVVVGVTSVQMPEKPFRMIVDRPFFVAIRDNKTGLVLFMGSIFDPS
ncbi:MAG: serpin family protein [bacterium]|nr:MAG: serpin family protein [bacterium]